MKKQLLLFLFTTQISIAQDRLDGKTWAGRSEVIAQNGMAATSHPLSTQAAIAVLRAGGNAIDAAIAANAMEGVVEPHVNGIGGDIFAIIWDAKTKKLYGLNGSGRSPYSLTLAEFKKRELKHIPALGPLPVSVPGCVDGWFEMHKLESKSVLEPVNTNIESLCKMPSVISVKPPWLPMVRLNCCMPFLLIPIRKAR